jgi:hypothetical protein
MHRRRSPYRRSTQGRGPCQRQVCRATGVDTHVVLQPVYRRVPVLIGIWQGDLWKATSADRANGWESSCLLWLQSISGVIISCVREGQATTGLTGSRHGDRRGCASSVSFSCASGSCARGARCGMCPARGRVGRLGTPVEWVVEIFDWPCACTTPLSTRAGLMPLVTTVRSVISRK